MSFKRKTDNPNLPNGWTFPPAQFSNAVNDIYGEDFDFTTWEKSKEWRLFNAGKAAALQDAWQDLRRLSDEAREKSK